MYTKICEAIKSSDILTLRCLMQEAGLEEANGTASAQGRPLWSMVDSDGRSVLQVAVESQNTGVLKCVMEALPGNCLVDLCAKKTSTSHPFFPESTPLHTAIAVGRMEVLESLLRGMLSARGQNGKPPSSTVVVWHTADANGRTPLAAALATGKLEIVKLVLGAIKTLERDMQTARGDRVPLVPGILQIDDIRVRGDNGLNMAVSTGNVGIVEVLIDALTPEELAPILTRCNLVGDTALDQAARAGNVDIVRLLVKKLGDLYEPWVSTPFQVVVESCAESKYKGNGAQVPEHFSMRLLGNAVSSGNAQVVKEVLGPLSIEERYKLLSRTSWGYPYPALHLAFSSGAHECVKIMLDSLVACPGGGTKYVSKVLAQRSGGLTPLHCAVDAKSVAVVQGYGLPKGVLFGLLTAGGSSCSPEGPVYVPDGMNPLQAMLAGPTGDGNPVPGAVGVIRAMLDLLEGDAVLMQRVLSSMDAGGRNTLYTFASLVGSRGVSATDFVTMLNYLEGRVNLRTLLEQKNMTEDVSTLDVVHEAEHNLYSWGFSLNDHVSQALNRQRGVSKSRASRLKVAGDAAVLSSFFLSCISGLIVVCSALYNVCSTGVKKKSAGFTVFEIAYIVFAFSVVMLLLTFFCITPGMHGAANRCAVITGDPRVNIPEPSFNDGISICANTEIQFRPEDVEKIEMERLHLRSKRDPMAVFSSSPSLSSSALSARPVPGLLVEQLSAFHVRDPGHHCCSTSENEGSYALEESPGTGIQGLAAEGLCDEQQKGVAE
ncbi:hypothetical protein NSE_0023 [Neorickettsia sennetsu str. Miyayama]|uniref:Uncharacterized protein n=2 Tax=Ehrlichia sennetsu TaxID=951 RepID=Q2GF30_EHRS3|nr:hypothetical protein NSE_0023 [Neorickettsia sennetsu str. Miyayama]